MLAHHRLARLRRAEADWEIRHAQFHEALLAACPSRPLLEFLGQMRDRAARFSAIATARAGRDVTAEHAAIAEVTLARDEARAVGLLEAHYRRTGEHLRQAWP